MFSKLLLAGVAAIGLLLAGPQKASAQVVYACVSSIGNIAIVASATANCPPNVGSATWTKVTLSAGALGASEFSCQGGPLTFLGPLFGSVGTYTPGVSFGSGITYTPMATTFVLQPGIYQLQLNVSQVAIQSPDGTGSIAFLRVPVLVNGTEVVTFEEDSLVVQDSTGSGSALFSVTGNKLLQITAANTTVGFNNVQFPADGKAFNTSCNIIFTRLQ
jgi:hypothetical protein